MSGRFQGIRELDRPIVPGVKPGLVAALVGGIVGLLGGGLGDVAAGAFSFGLGSAGTVTVLAYIAAYRFARMRRDGERRSLVLWFFRSEAEDRISFRWPGDRRPDQSV